MKKINNMFWFILLIIYLEMVYKFAVSDGILVMDIIRIIIFSIPIAIFFYLISNIYSKKINRIASILITIIITVIFVSQFIYFAFYKSIFSVYSLTTGTVQVFGFFTTIIDMIKRHYIIIITMLLPMIIYLFLHNKIFSFKRYNKVKFVYSLVFLLLINIIVIISIITDNKDMYSLSNLYNNVHAPIITANKMGLLTMERLDIKRYLFGFNEKILKSKKVKALETDKEEEILYNVLNIDFKKLKNEETNETIKDMHDYFSNVKPTKKNKYTGIFKGKNLIYITAEGFDKIAISEELTPTLYKMSHNGFVFNNYYQPLFTVSTSDGEYMLMTSLIPKEGVWSMSRSSNINMKFSLGHMFKSIGYTTNAYHNHTYTYYDREKSHPNLGFNYMGCGNGLEKEMNCKIWPESDIEMMEVTVPKYIKEDKFLTYYMTVSGHLNYTFIGNSMSYKNRKLVENLKYSDNVKAYIAANIELDRAMEKLLNFLEEEGKLEDTVIVISPDHYPYGLKVGEINEVSKINRDDKFNLYKTVLILYNAGMKEPVYVDKYVGSIDVLPTIYNMFGLDYDSRLYMGRDAFSDENGLVILSDRSWINEKGKYNSIKDEFTPFVDDLPDDYKDIINHEVYQKFTISSQILNNNKGVYLDYYGKITPD